MPRIRTHAKVNLVLNVLGRRPDGYHEIETIYHGIKLADDIAFEATRSGTVEVEMHLSEGLSGEAPKVEDNLVYVAAQRLLERGATTDGMKITVTKRVPLGAGLGGGSANAAGTLTVLSERWDLHLDRRALLEVAALVGSDVPYCIGGGTALATGRGEQVTALPSHTMWFVLGLGPDPLSTHAVYEKWDEVGPGEPEMTAPMTIALGAGDTVEVAALLHNDLEQAAFALQPALQDKKAALMGAGALGAVMSGSGPTMLGIATSEEEAHSVASGVKEVFDQVLVVPTHPHCVERVG